MNANRYSDAQKSPSAERLLDALRRCVRRVMPVGLLLSSITVARGEDVERPVTAAYTYEVGTSHICDTYLTPLHYNGWQMALNYERWQAMKFNPERWVMSLAGRLSVDRDNNPARNATMWGADLDLSWSMLYRQSTSLGLEWAVGGLTRLNVGVLYLNRNSNNPASAKAAWTVGVAARLNYHLRLGRLPVTLSYRPSVPLTGVFFSPDYDELYYEIYLGNHAGLAHAAWFGNYFRLEQYLAADLRFGTTALRLGYRCGIESTKQSGIVNRNISHCFTIGVSGEWLSIGRSGRPKSDVRYVSAYYQSEP